MRNRSVLLPFILGVLFYGSAGYAAPAECRMATLPDGILAMFCKDDSGKWKQQDGEVAITPSIPVAAGVSLSADANYRGIVVFQIPIRTRQRPVRGVTDLLARAAEPQTQPQEILATTVMRIEGGMISGTITGGGWQINVPITGTRKNGLCNIAGTYQGASVNYVGKCDESGFAGQAKVFPSNGASYTGSFNLETVSFLDTSARDAKRTDLKARCDGGSTTACVELDQLR